MVKWDGGSGKALNLLVKELEFGFIHIKFDMSVEILSRKLDTREFGALIAWR